MAKKTFSPYAKGVPEKKTYPSRYDNVRDTTVASGPKPAGPRPQPGVKPASPPERATPSVPGQVAPLAGHASTRVPGAGRGPSVPSVDRDLLDGLEGNHRRQRGWEDDSAPNTLVDGITITPISKDELKKKLAAQKSGGFLGGKNL